MLVTSEPAHAASSRLPDYQDMLAVYARSIAIRQMARALLDVSDAMALLAVNAEITAEKSDTNRGPFTIIANEAKRIATQTESLVESIQRASRQLERRSIGDRLSEPSV